MEKVRNSVGDKIETQVVSFEDALNIVGTGKYNVALQVVSGLLLVAMAMEMFGFSFIVTASTCDLQLTMQQQGILLSLPFMSIICSSFLWGYFSDTRGRRLVLMWSMYTGFVLTSLSSLSPNWIVLAVFKFVSVCFSCAANAATYTLLGECCPAAVRSRQMLFATIPLMFSQGFTGLLAYPVFGLDFSHDLPWLGVAFRPWRLLVIVTAIPCGLSALCLHLFYESPKFLAGCGRNDEAVEVLGRIYSINKGVHPDLFPVKSITLDETTAKKHDNQSLLSSMWEQTVPLFRPPMLLTTLKLYFLITVIYMTNNSFCIWFPRLFTSLFSNLQTSGDSNHTLCSLLSVSSVAAANRSDEFQPDLCIDKMDDNTIWFVVAESGAMTILSVCVAQLYARKKAVIISCLVLPCISAVCVPLMPDPVSGVLMFFVVTATALSSGIVSSYFVELYPTSYRGMVACLGVMVGRLSAFFGINIVGVVIFTHCQATFYTWSVLLFVGIAVAYHLPPDKPNRSN